MASLEELSTRESRRGLAYARAGDEQGRARVRGKSLSEETGAKVERATSKAQARRNLNENEKREWERLIKEPNMNSTARGRGVAAPRCDGYETGIKAGQ